MFNLSKVGRRAAWVAMCVSLQACGLAELGAVQAVSAAQRAKQANAGVGAEKEAKRKVEEAMERAEVERSKTISDQVAGPSDNLGNRVNVRAGGIDSAMKAAEDQSK